MTTQRSSLALLRPFFGTTIDERGETFTHLNYDGNAFGVAVNTGAIDSIENLPIFQLLLSKNYIGHIAAFDKFLHQSMIDLIINTAQFHKLVDTGALSNGIVGNVYAKFLVDSIYKQWPNLSQDVRTFYITHLQILMKNKAGQWRKPIVENGIEISAGIPAANIRLNLTKVDPTNKGSAILFATTLPRIPSSIQGMLYTGINASGKEEVMSISFAGKTVSANLLEEIYTSVYGGALNEMFVAGDRYYVPPFKSFDSPTDSYPHYNLNQNLFLQNVMTASSSPVATASKAVTPREAAFDDIYESMVTGVQYIRKGDDLFTKDKDGKESKYNEAEAIAAKSCYGTGLKDNNNCTTIFNCLLSGNTSRLGDCLEDLKGKDMFKVGQTEVQNMPPSVALSLLKTFGFKPRKELPSMNILPPTFDEWSSTILLKQVSPATAEGIKNNKPLMDYLKGVVSFVRSNPSILKENKGDDNIDSDYVKHAKIKVFKQPFTPSNRSTLNASILDLGVLSSAPTINSLPFSLALGNPMMFPSMFGQRGGGINPACVNSKALEQMFKVTYSEMERNGKQLIDSDKNRISDAVKKVAELEEKLMKIVRDLKVFNKLNAALSVKQGPIGIEDITLSEIHTSNQNPVTSEAVNNLTNCASQNISELNKLIGVIMSRIQRPLVSEVIGNQTGGSMIEVA